VLQRFRASKSKKQAQIALLLNSPFILFIIWACGFSGLIIYTVYEKCDPLFTKQIDTPNQYVSFFIMDKFNTIPGAIGLFLGAIFCSSLSSLSSAQNSSASIIWTDFMLLFPYFRSLSDKKALRVNKLIVLTNGVLCAAFTYLLSLNKDKNLIQIAVTLNGAFNGPLLALFWMSLLFRCINKYGATSGLIVGVGMTMWLSVGSYITNPVYPKLPVSIESCFNQTRFENFTSPIISFDDKVSIFSGIDKFYSISFQWFAVFGALITFIVGIVVSLLTGGRWQTVSDDFVLCDLLAFLSPDSERKEKRSQQSKELHEAEIQKHNIRF
jgi:sodium-coupled monocarboxylate transporter 8/12